MVGHRDVLLQALPLPAASGILAVEDAIVTEVFERAAGSSETFALRAFQLQSVPFV
jgi:hypothetical protein